MGWLGGMAHLEGQAGATSGPDDGGNRHMEGGPLWTPDPTPDKAMRHPTVGKSSQGGKRSTLGSVPALHICDFFGSKTSLCKVLQSNKNQAFFF